VSFFEAPPPPPEPSPQPRVPWEGPPNNILGVVVSLDLVLARSEKAVVTLGSLTGYPTGFEMEYLVRCRQEELGQLLPDHLHRPGRRSVGEGLPAELFRFGIEFGDGTRATSLRPTRAFESLDLDEPVMVPRGGGGSFERWQGQWWVWPLPPLGPLAFVCEWPAADIGLTRAEIDAAVLHEAASRAVTLWEDAAPSGSSGFGYSVIQSVRGLDPPAEHPQSK
jgi:hypothetical protein